MSATSDNALHIGEETTYNTAVTPSRSYPISADTWQLELSELAYEEMKAGQVAGAAESTEYYERGGVGSIPKPVRSLGDGLLWKAAVGTSSITGTVQTHSTDVNPSSTSLTVQTAKGICGTDPQVYTYSGSVITEWSLEHSPGDVLKADYQFYWKGPLDSTTAEATAAYPSGGRTFRWNELDISLGGFTLAATAFDLTVNNALNTDQDYLATTQPRACRTGKLEATGSLEVPINANTKSLIDDALKNAAEPLVLTWQKADGDQELFKVEIPSVRIKPQLGEMSLDDMTKVKLEFMVVDDTAGTNPAIKITYDTKSDTAF